MRLAYFSKILRISVLILFRIGGTRVGMTGFIEHGMLLCMTGYTLISTRTCMK